MRSPIEVTSRQSWEYVRGGEYQPPFAPVETHDYHEASWDRDTWTHGYTDACGVITHLVARGYEAAVYADYSTDNDPFHRYRVAKNYIRTNAPVDLVRACVNPFIWHSEKIREAVKAGVPVARPILCEDLTAFTLAQTMTDRVKVAIFCAVDSVLRLGAAWTDKADKDRLCQFKHHWHLDDAAARTAVDQTDAIISTARNGDLPGAEALLEPAKAFGFPFYREWCGARGAKYAASPA